MPTDADRPIGRSQRLINLSRDMIRKWPGSASVEDAPSRHETIHVFLSIEDRSLCGLSTDILGENFPDRYGAWENLGIAMPIDSALATMAKDIAFLIERDAQAIVRNATAGGVWPGPRPA
jgi:hypothetical protein